LISFNTPSHAFLTRIPTPTLTQQLGVRRRKSLLASAGPTVTPGAAKRVEEPLDKAIAIYTQLGDQRQLAAARFATSVEELNGSPHPLKN
jgi:hypothetical protein